MCKLKLNIATEIKCSKSVNYKFCLTDITVHAEI